jgi:transcriptional regulator with XRE-family HTH domain
MEKENERILELRETLGITQSEMAKSIGVSKQYFSRVEKGKTELSKHKIIELCSKHSVSLNWLLKDIGNMFMQDIDKPRVRVKVLQITVG